MPLSPTHKPLPPRYIAVPFLAGGSSPLPITTPTISATTISSSQINLVLSYSPPPPATSFAFEQSSSPSGPFVPIASQAGSSFPVVGLSQNTQYSFRGRVQVNDGRFSQFSNVSTTNTLAAVPGQVTGLAVTGSTSTTVSLSWLAPQFAVTYNVYQNGVRVQSGLSSLSTTVTGLAPGSTFSFTVSSSNATGEGSQSSPVTGITSTSGTAFKFQPGHYLCQGFGHSGVAESQSLIDAIVGHSAKGIQVDMYSYVYDRGTAGPNYAGDSTRSWGRPFIQDLLDYAAARGKYILLGTEDRTFGSIPSPPSNSLTHRYPPWYITNGWAQANTVTPPQSIATLWVPATLSAWVNMWIDILQNFDTHPALVMVCPFGETAISNGVSPTNETKYYDACVSGFQSLSAFNKNTPMRWQCNNTNGTLYSRFQTLSTIPGMFIGGPDMEGPGPDTAHDTRNVQAWQQFRGTNPVGTDYRGTMGFVAEFQAFSAVNTPNQQSMYSLQQALPQSNQYCVWGLASGAAQFAQGVTIPFIDSVGGLAPNMSPPSNGSYAVQPPSPPSIVSVNGLTMGRQVTLSPPATGNPITGYYVVDTNGGSPDFKSTTAVGATIHPGLNQFIRPDYTGTDTYVAYAYNSAGWSLASAPSTAVGNLLPVGPQDPTVVEPWFMYSDGNPINCNGDFSQPVGADVRYPNALNTGSVIQIDWFNQEQGNVTGSGPGAVKCHMPVPGAFEPCINSHTIDWSSKAFWTCAIKPLVSGWLFDIAIETAGDVVTTDNLFINGTSAWVNNGSSGGAFLPNQWNVVNIPRAAFNLGAHGSNNTMYKMKLVCHSGSVSGDIWIDSIGFCNTPQTV